MEHDERNGRDCQCRGCTLAIRYRRLKIRFKDFIVGFPNSFGKYLKSQVWHHDCQHMIANFAAWPHSPREMYVACKVCESEWEHSYKPEKLIGYSPGTYSGSTYTPIPEYERIAAIEKDSEFERRIQ